MPISPVDMPFTPAAGVQISVGKPIELSSYPVFVSLFLCLCGLFSRRSTGQFINQNPVCFSRIL